MTAMAQDAVLERADEYDALLRRHGGMALVDASVLELRRGDARRLPVGRRAWQLDPARDDWLTPGVGPPDGSVDLVVAEEAFEHVDPVRLMRLVPRISRWLTPGSIALVRSSGAGLTRSQYRALLELDFVLLEERTEHATGRTLFAVTPLGG